MEVLTIRELRSRATEYGNRLNECVSNHQENATAEDCHGTNKGMIFVYNICLHIIDKFSQYLVAFLPQILPLDFP